MEPAPQKSQGALRRLLAAPATTTLLLACVLVFIAAERTGSTKDIPTLIRFGATWRGLVWDGEWWRLFSAMFLHIGVVHLVWNCWGGFQWAAPVEAALGSWRFLVLYLLSGLAGSAVSVIGHDVVAAGASGALFGVVGATFALLRIKLGSWKALWQHPVHQKNLGMAALWFVVGAFAGFDNFAHAGGLAAGLGLTWALRPDVRGAQLGPRLGFVGAALAAIVLASVRPLPLLHEPARLFALARAADESGDFDRVLSLTDAWKVTGAAEDGPALTLRTRALSEKARWPETEATATQAIQLRPDFAYLFQVRALARSHLGRDQEAIADCREAQRLAPEEPWPHEFEAELHQNSGRRRRSSWAPRYARRSCGQMPSGASGASTRPWTC
ncbi:MAG: rhomboid family intramembrane serine protease [Myxococcales bacterium]|nr:rhomboid family intramembrane serine protease [Myxococcales bacterium]